MVLLIRLQEMLTVKSDDVAMAVRRFMNLLCAVMTAFEAGIPESFNVLVKEMKSLCLNVQLKIANFNANKSSETREPVAGDKARGNLAFYLAKQFIVNFLQCP